MEVRSVSGLAQSRAVTQGLSRGRSTFGRVRKREHLLSALSTTGVGRTRAAVSVQVTTALFRTTARRAATRCHRVLFCPAGRGTCH